MAKRKRKKPQSEYMRRKAKLARKPSKPRLIRDPTAKQIARAGERIIKQRELLRPLIREAAKAGATEAIEHCHNFWSVSDGYKKYIDHQIKTQAEALMAAVRTALRDELQANRRKQRS